MKDLKKNMGSKNKVRKSKRKKKREEFEDRLFESDDTFAFIAGYTSGGAVEAGLEQICEICGIKLRRVKKLQAIEEFREGMRQFM